MMEGQIERTVRRRCCCGGQQRGMVFYLGGVFATLSFLVLSSIGRLDQTSMNVNSSLTSTRKMQRSARWNSTQLRDRLHYHNGTPSTIELLEVLELAPKPEGEDVEIYNMNAWYRLREIILGTEDETHAKSTNGVSTSRIVVCSNGGSSTAGGGNVPEWQRWDRQFAEVIRLNQKSLDVEVVNRGHGARGSVHSAFLMHSLIPATTDVLIWEFAINDCTRKGCEDINNGIIVWLDQVARLFSPPPLVILAYLWNPNFPPKESEDGTFPRVMDTVFQCHNRLGAAYDFVVGSVHLGSYLSNLRWEYGTLQQVFLSDNHHQSFTGHTFLAFLLWDLVAGDERRPILLKNDTATARPRSPLRPTTQWSCKQDPPAKQRVISLLSEQSSFASWTAEAPRNENHNGGMLSPQLLLLENRLDVPSGVSTATSNMTSILHGKASEARQDRQFSFALPCCATGERLTFDLSTLVRQNDTMSTGGSSDAGAEWVSALQVYAPHVTTVKMLSTEIVVDLFLLTNNTTARKNRPTELISQRESKLFQNSSTSSNAADALKFPPEWVHFDSGECRVGHWFLNTWLVLPEATLVSRIDFCHQCIISKPEAKAVSLAHVAVF